MDRAAKVKVFEGEIRKSVASEILQMYGILSVIKTKKDFLEIEEELDIMKEAYVNIYSDLAEKVALKKKELGLSE